MCNFPLRCLRGEKCAGTTMTCTPISTAAAALLFSFSFHHFSKTFTIVIYKTSWHSCSKLISVPLAQLMRNSLVLSDIMTSNSDRRQVLICEAGTGAICLIKDSNDDYSVTETDGFVCVVNSETHTLRLTGINRETDTFVVDRSVCGRAWGGDAGIDGLSGWL